MRYMVTGGAGFVGSNLVAELVDRGEEVVVYDNFSTGKRENLREFVSEISIVDGDLRDFWQLLDSMKGVDFVLHQAALPSVPRSVENPLTSNSINTNGTLNVLECAKRQRVKKVVYASSSSVYGDTPTLPKHEDMTPMPLSPYAVSKLTGEYYCRVYSQLYGLAAISSRYFNVFGPRQDPKSQYAAVIPKFITSLLNDEPPLVFGDGEQSRDFTYIDNVVNAVLIACEDDSIRYGEYNLACGSQYTLNQLLQELCCLLGKDIKAQYDPPRAGDIKHSFADISKAERDFGITPIVQFRDGLEKTVAYFKRTSMLKSSV